MVSKICLFVCPCVVLPWPVAIPVTINAAFIMCIVALNASNLILLCISSIFTVFVYYYYARSDTCHRRNYILQFRIANLKRFITYGKSHSQIHVSSYKMLQIDQRICPESMKDFMSFCQNHGNRPNCLNEPLTFFSKTTFSQIPDHRSNFVYNVP